MQNWRWQLTVYYRSSFPQDIIKHYRPCNLQVLPSLFSFIHTWISSRLKLSTWHLHSWNFSSIFWHSLLPLIKKNSIPCIFRPSTWIDFHFVTKKISFFSELYNTTTATVCMMHCLTPGKANSTLQKEAGKKPCFLDCSWNKLFWS